MQASNIDDGTERFPWLPSGFDVETKDVGGDHVFLFIGPVLSSQLAWADEILTAEEHDRASRFVFDLHRNRFRFRRAVLRKILAHWQSVDPTDIRLIPNAWGKLFLNSRAREKSPQFNLSHSGDAIAIATSSSTEIGIDIELHRPLPEIESMAQMVMHAQELEVWQKLPLDDRSHWFFNLWAIKEAVLKCIGCGLAIEPASFATNPGAPLGARQSLELIDPNGIAWQVEVRLIDSFAGFSSALAKRIRPRQRS